MNKRKLQIRVLSLIVFIFFFNYFAMKFHWYSLLPWLDMLMHFLGGAWLLLAATLIIPFQPDAPGYFIKAFVLVLVVALLWEVFEFVLNMFTTRNPFDFRDMISDLFFDLAGAVSALIYFLKKIVPRG